MRYPFEVTFEVLQADIDTYVDEVFGELQSDFLAMPKGKGFVEYSIFERGYEELKRVTGGFQDLSLDSILKAVYQVPVGLVVLRTILGFTPPEWAYVTSQRTDTKVPQGAARTLDRTVRLKPLTPMLPKGGITEKRIRAMVEAAIELLTEGAPRNTSLLHRLDKADTKEGLMSLHPLANLGVPYAMLLYERFLGRPFAGHRDSISEMVGDILESAIESTLTDAGISFRKTKRAERVTGFDQAPDFIVPDEFSPQVVIEAKITEDDGTARDKVTRVQHLGELSMVGREPGEPPRFEVIACISGRGFKVRREDMKKLLKATRGKVFTLETLNRLIECSRLKEFKTY